MNATREFPDGTPSPVFFPLFAPFGLAKGYVAVALSYHLATVGLPTAIVATIVSFAFWPQTIKVIWAPLVDALLDARTWSILGTLITSFSILAISLVPARLDAVPVFIFLVVLSSVASTLISMSCELLMAQGVEDGRKGSASGWAQAGNVGGAGIGGGLGLYLSEHVAPWTGGAALMLVCLLCSLALLLVQELPKRRIRSPHFRALTDIGREVRAMVGSRQCRLTMVLMILPIGAGGVLGLWAAIAPEWAMKTNTIALVNGVFGGLAAVVGAVSAGFLYDRWGRRTIYCGFGLALAAVTILMGLLPKTPEIFVAGTLTYAAVIGGCYAGYSAITLETIGLEAAATKFNLLASIANVPIALMTQIDGYLHDHYGANGMLLGEAGIGIMAVLSFGALAWWMQRSGSIPGELKPEQQI